ncbi:MAG: 16S rRNA (guanine(527)-N(7))-methyltransferase RsmG [gamma proteobacterium symbiont of Taylorina sp.]|nr:16S rRNA (guanine(527)-N(7))-methyltransferase RsmG [gamma proteobacterium symbiont of Taylorina sp.]
MGSLEQLLAAGLAQQSLSIGDEQQQKLIQFVHLLHKWNKVYNLTSIRDKTEIVTLHLLDSLSILPFFTEEGTPLAGKVLDVGTGGGIPGIPLAICLPDIDFVLLDARGKKIRFIQTVIAQLELKNVKAVQSRVEDYEVTDQFERIISRAFASLEDMLNYCRHLCHPQGQFLAMKGQILKEEIAQLPEGFKIDGINELKISGLNAQRHLVQITFQS